MKHIDFENKLEKIIQRDSRYPAEAYVFVNAAVKHTVDKLTADPSRGNRHVNAQELLEGLVSFALEQFGPLAWNVLSDWHLCHSRDIGNVVFNMIAENLFAKSSEDSEEDFDQGFDLKSALETPFDHNPEKGNRHPDIPIIA